MTVLRELLKKVQLQYWTKKTISCFILGGCSFLWEAKEAKNEALNQRGTENAAITVSKSGKDASKDNTGDLLDAKSDDFDRKLCAWIIPQW